MSGFVTEIFNESVSSGIIPDELELARIVPLHES